MNQLSKSEIQARLFELLSAFADYCDSHQLRYYLCGGTLLGAIRHHDFIPWDDDIDVLMPRPDYDALHKRIREEPVGTHYQLYSLLSGTSSSAFAKLANQKISLDFPYNTFNNFLWIDIFPMDGVPQNEAECNCLLKKALSLKTCYERSGAKLGNGKTAARAVLKIPVVLLAKCFGSTFWGKRIDRMARKIDFNNSEYVASIAGSCGPCERMKKAEYVPQVDVMFHGRAFHAPACWDKYLTQMYGDYMTLPPESKRKTHDFAAYENR